MRYLSRFQLQFQHDKFTEIVVDTSRIVQHSWRKLRDIYSDIFAAYRAALDRFTASGTHDSDPLFFNYCVGRIDALYLHCHVTVQPMLIDDVEVELQLETFMDSEALSLGKKVRQ
jgi:hypothetical protein